jgi:glutaconate CoA-transferase subunit A
MMKHMEAYVAQVNGDPLGGMQAYLDRYFYEPTSWNDFLSLIGIDELIDASRKGRSIYND